MSKKISTLVAFLLAMSLILAGCTGSTPAPQSSAAPSGSNASAASSAPTVNYPTKTVEVVYHSGVGSGGDIMLRAMDQALVNAAAAGKTKHVGWVINNMTGGAGAISWEYSKKANPDGYTLLGVSSTFLTAPLLNDMDVSYEDFTPIAMLLIDPQVIAVPANSPYQTFDDLIKDAKATPGTQSWAAGVAGSLAFVGGLEIQKKFDCKVNLVPFEGGADAAASLMGGHLTAAISEFVEVREAAEGGLVKILAAFNPLSAKGFEDVPTMAELGYPDIEITKIRGILGPKGMDPAVVDAVIEQINVMLQEDSFKQYIDSNALIMDLRTKDDFYKIMEEQTALLKESLAS